MTNTYMKKANNKRRFISFLLAAFGIMSCCSTAYAQEFGSHWITSQEANDSSQIWFRRSYITKDKPQQATLAIATTGSIQVFVNERKLSSALLMPLQDEENKEEAISIKFDITQYLRNDTNTIAIWYAPTSVRPTDKAISVNYYGRNSKGAYFSYVSDRTWLTRRACGWNKGDVEGYDARLYDKTWKKSKTDLKKWNYAFGSADKHSFTLTDKTIGSTTLKKHRIFTNTTIHTDSIGTTYSFSHSFTGQVRLTIRNAKPGYIFHIGNYTYICNGTTDEQAYRKFTVSTQKDALVTGEMFRPSMIQKAEGIEYLPTSRY